MKQETIDLLKELAAKSFKGEKDVNSDYEYGYYHGALDAQISLAQEILKLEQIEEITS